MRKELTLYKTPTCQSCRIAIDHLTKRRKFENFKIVVLDEASENEEVRQESQKVVQYLKSQFSVSGAPFFIIKTFDDNDNLIMVQSWQGFAPQVIESEIIANKKLF